MSTEEELLNGIQSYYNLIKDAIVNNSPNLAILASENLTMYLQVNTDDEKESE